MDQIIICRVKSGQTQCRQLAKLSQKCETSSASRHRSTGLSLLDAISFYRRHNGPAVQYGNDSAETTGVKEGQSQLLSKDENANWFTKLC